MEANAAAAAAAVVAAANNTIGPAFLNSPRFMDAENHMTGSPLHHHPLHQQPLHPTHLPPHMMHETTPIAIPQHPMQHGHNHIHPHHHHPQHQMLQNAELAGSGSYHSPMHQLHANHLLEHHQHQHQLQQQHHHLAQQQQQPHPLSHSYPDGHSIEATGMMMENAGLDGVMGVENLVHPTGVMGNSGVAAPGTEHGGYSSAAAAAAAAAVVSGGHWSGALTEKDNGGLEGLEGDGGEGGDSGIGGNAAAEAAATTTAANAASAADATALQIQRANEQHLAYVRERASAYLKPIIGETSMEREREREREREKERERE